MDQIGLLFVRFTFLVDASDVFIIVISFCLLCTFTYARRSLINDTLFISSSDASVDHFTVNLVSASCMTSLSV